MRRGAAVRADLDDAVRVPRGAHHRLAFADGVRDRFFDVNVRARFHRRDRRQRVPVIGRGHDDDLRLFLREQFAVVAVASRRVTGNLGHVFGRGGELPVVDIAQPDDLALSARHGFAEDVAAPPAAADDRGAVFAPGFFGAGSLDRKRRKRARGSGGLEKRTPVHEVRAR